MKVLTEVRTVLPDDTKGLFDDIVNQNVLGASNHINMIGDMIGSIALHGQRSNRATIDIIEDILVLTDFFKETRGEASQAISNAIDIMVKGIHSLKANENLVQVVEMIIDTKNRYLIDAKAALETAVAYGVEIVKTKKQIMVFDYSSTIDQLLRKVAEVNQELTVVIPESRSIDGGHAFVKTCLEVGHQVKFIPDAAIMYFLKNCDGAFMGVETYFPDGTMFNTTGSDIVGLVCKEFKIPLYAVTPLIKLDIRQIHGYKKELVINNLENRLALNWQESEKVNTDFRCPELLPVDPQYIAAFITELGVIPANQMYSVSIDYYNSLKES